MAAASPWTFFSMPRVVKIKEKYNLYIDLKPLDIFTLFNRQGIKLVAERPQAVQANRLNELRRWKEFLKVKMNLKPKFFPVNPIQSSKILISAKLIDKSEGKLHSLNLAKNYCDAVWKYEKNIDNIDTLIKIATKSGFNGKELQRLSNTEEILKILIENTEEAISKNVFGIPSFIFDNEVYWGQDRLDFVERHIKTIYNL